MSNTDKLQYYIDVLSNKQKILTKGEFTKLSPGATKEVLELLNQHKRLISQLEQAKVALHTHESYDKTVCELQAENEQLNKQMSELKELMHEQDKFISKYIVTIEQLKADKQKLIEEIKNKISNLDKRIANMSKHEPVHCDHSERISGLEGEAYIWEKALELVEQALSEVKG